MTPASITTGNFTLTVNGAGFVSGSVVSFDGLPLATSFVSAARVTATGNAQTAKPAVPVVVRTPDGEESNTALVNVTASAPVSITISPTTATVRIRQTRQFSASVQGTANKSKSWKVNGVVGGNSTVGTITQSGF